MKAPRRTSSLSLIPNSPRWCHPATTTWWPLSVLNRNGFGQNDSNCSCISRSSVRLSMPGCRCFWEPMWPRTGSGGLGSSFIACGRWLLAVVRNGKIGLARRSFGGSTSGHELRPSRFPQRTRKEHWAPNTASWMNCSPSRLEADTTLSSTLTLTSTLSHTPTCTRTRTPSVIAVPHAYGGVCTSVWQDTQGTIRALPTSKTGSLEYNPLATEPSPVRAVRLGRRQSGSLRQPQRRHPS